MKYECRVKLSHHIIIFWAKMNSFLKTLKKLFILNFCWLFSSLLTHHFTDSLEVQFRGIIIHRSWWMIERLSRQFFYFNDCHWIWEKNTLLYPKYTTSHAYIQHIYKLFSHLSWWSRLYFGKNVKIKKGFIYTIQNFSVLRWINGWRSPAMRSSLCTVLSLERVFHHF